MTVDGIETVEAFVLAQDAGEPYDLLCLGIMMPKIDGLKALRTIRGYEKKKGVRDSEKCKVIITSALGETEVAFDSFSTGSEVYETKPITAERVMDDLNKLKLI